VYKIIDLAILDLMGVLNPEKYLTEQSGLPAAYVNSNSEGVPENQQCANCSYYDPITSGCSRWDQTVNPVFWCQSWQGRVETAINYQEGD
jgi:hypothetical protein